MVYLDQQERLERNLNHIRYLAVLIPHMGIMSQEWGEVMVRQATRYQDSAQLGWLFNENGYYRNRLGEDGNYNVAKLIARGYAATVGEPWYN